MGTVTVGPVLGPGPLGRAPARILREENKLVGLVRYARAGGSKREGLVMDTKRHWYTVICLYPDYLTDDYGADIYVDWALAKSPEDAGRLVQKKAQAAQNDGECDVVDDPADFRVIAVWKGKTVILADATNFEYENTHPCPRPKSLRLGTGL